MTHGYIIADDQAIWGSGKTPDEAVSQAYRWRPWEGTDVLNSGNVDAYLAAHQSLLIARELRLYRATHRLLNEVDACGGDINWITRRDGVCDLPEEQA